MIDRIRVTAQHVVTPQNGVLTLVLQIPEDKAEVLRDILGPSSVEESRAFVKTGVREKKLDEREATQVFDSLMFDLYDKIADAYPEKDSD